MFGFLKKKKKGNERGMTIGTYHSGDASIEAMKDEFFKHFNAGESAGMLMGDEHFRKAYDVAKEWTKHEDTNRSYGCLAAAAFKLGASNMDREKLRHAVGAFIGLQKAAGRCGQHSEQDERPGGPAPQDGCRWKTAGPQA